MTKYVTLSIPPSFVSHLGDGYIMNRTYYVQTCDSSGALPLGNVVSRASFSAMVPFLAALRPAPSHSPDPLRLR